VLRGVDAFKSSRTEWPSQKPCFEKSSSPTVLDSRIHSP